MKLIRAFPLAIVTLLLAVTANDALACSCPTDKPFLKVAPQSVLVIRGRILHHTGDEETMTEMEVEVLETLAGEPPKSVVSVSGDPGNQCRPYVSAFPVE